jgi:hypothetical protein
MLRVATVNAHPIWGVELWSVCRIGKILKLIRTR